MFEIGTIKYGLELGYANEAEVKSAVSDYLTYAMNQGKLWFCRLNAGDFIELRGETRRRIKGAPKGTSDYIVIQGGEVQMVHIIQQKIHKTQPVAFVTFIECKSTKGKQSPDQLEFEEMITKLNCRYFIVRSVEELQEALERE